MERMGPNLSTIRKRTESGRLPPKVAIRYALCALEALEHIHRRECCTAT